MIFCDTTYAFFPISDDTIVVFIVVVSLEVTSDDDKVGKNAHIQTEILYTLS